MQNNKKNAIATTLSILGIVGGFAVAITMLIKLIVPSLGVMQDFVPLAILALLFSVVGGVATWFCFRVQEEVISLLQQCLNNQEVIMKKLFDQNQTK